MADGFVKTDEWVLGAGDTPFFTSRWFPAVGKPSAYVLFVHGFAEHITRYSHFFPLLASPPHNIHITAFDQRGHGRTSHAPLQPDSGTPEQEVWKSEGRSVKYEPKGDGGKRRTGGWKRIIPDIEFMVRREGERAGRAGRGLWLWGFSMGGAEVLKFATHPPFLSSPTSPLSLLTGIISGGPLIRQTRPASSIQLTAGSLASKLLPDMLIPTPLVYSDLSHNEESNEKNKADPWCEQVGSLRGVADMLNGGMELDRPETWARWKEEIALMVYHGEEDGICDPRASRRFLEGVRADRKHYELVKGMYHEVHNEHPPVPEHLAEVIATFILEALDRNTKEAGKAAVNGTTVHGMAGVEAAGARVSADSKSRL